MPVASAAGAARLWYGLGLFAFSLATAYSVLLVLLRVPSGLAAESLFRPALAAHVVLAMWGWFLCVVIAGWCEAVDGRGLRRAALPAALGIVALATSPFLGERVLPVNYLPWIEHPLFAAGVGLVALALLLAAASAAGGLRRRDRDPGDAARSSVVWSVVVVAAATLSAARAAASDDLSPEQRLWGPAHLMQFLFVIALCESWLRVVGGSPRLAGRHHAAWLGGTALFGCLASLLLAPDSAAYRSGHTWLMSLGLWPVPLALIVRSVREGRLAVPGAAALAVRLSMLLFVVGCGIGVLIRGDSLMIPAHYHATVGAITLALMARYHAAPATRDGLARAQLAVYAAGLLLMCAGLVLGALAALPRKTPWRELMAAGDPLAGASAGLLAAGGAAAILGAFAFVVLGWWKLFGRRPAGGPPPWNASGITTGLKNGNSRG